MDTREPSSPTNYRLRELVVHAREGSPIAFAAVLKFIEMKLPQIPPQLVLSFAERVLESCQNGSRAPRVNGERASSTEDRLRPWPRDDQAGCLTASGPKDEARRNT